MRVGSGERPCWCEQCPKQGYLQHSERARQMLEQVFSQDDHEVTLLESNASDK